MSNLLKLAHEGDEPADLYDLSKKWGINMERLQFLAACPKDRSKSFINNYEKFTGKDREYAVACRLVFRQGWTHYEAAEKLNVSPNKVTRWLKAKGIVWPDGCKRKADWGGPLGAQIREAGNLLGSTKANDPDSSPIPGKPKRIKKGIAGEVVIKAHKEGLTIKQASLKYGIKYITLWMAARKNNLKFPQTGRWA